MQSLPDREDELDKFKRDINLSEYAASVGFTKNSRKSSKNTVVMKRENGDCILISISEAEHWIYCSTDERSNGTIVDFVQWIDHCNLGEARKILRRWSGMPEAIPESTFQKKVDIAKKDRPAILRLVNGMKSLTQSDYLESRGISQHTINRPIFRRRLLMGYSGAIIFPHWDEKGICGYEVKKQGFTSFSEKGNKSIWYSRIPEDVERLVFCESGIENLSYAQLFFDEKAAYFTASGNWSKMTSERIKNLFLKYGNNVEILAAYNKDQGGQRQADNLKKLAQQVGNHCFKCHFPENTGDDWNDVLKTSWACPTLND